MKRIDLFKDAFAITCGYILGKGTLKVAASVFVKIMDSWTIKLANKGNQEAQDFCKKWNLKYKDNWDKSMSDDLDNIEVFFHNREEAESLMKEVHDQIEEYDLYRVLDLRESLGLPYKEYKGCPGWSNPDCCNIFKEGSLYILHFEPVEYFEDLESDGKPKVKFEGWGTKVIFESGSDALEYLSHVIFRIKENGQYTMEDLKLDAGMQSTVLDKKSGWGDEQDCCKLSYEDGKYSVVFKPSEILDFGKVEE